jgi:zinc transport system permease protein
MIFLEEHFMQLAFLAGIGLAMAAGPLGCFITWRRMAYFGDALSHSALLGIALGLLTGITPGIGVLAVSFAFALLLLALQQKKMLASDTLLGILSHTALAVGMVIISLIHGVKFDLFSYLFGDILSVSVSEVLWLYVGSALCLLYLALNWKALVLLTIHEDLAKAEGLPVFFLQLGFMITVAIVIALAMRMVGILLITSLLIIPAATARQLALTPMSMAIQASIYGMVSVVVGIILSYYFDTPTGPTIVSVSVSLFILISFINAALGRNE